MRPLVLVALSIIMVGAAAQPVDRPLVEAHLDRAMENRVAEADEQILRERGRAVEAESGPRFFGALGTSHVQDVVTRDVVRSYPAVSAQIGLRWPILGSRDNEVRQQASANAALEQNQLQRTTTRMDALRILRTAYVEALRRNEQVALADAFLVQEEEATRILRQRWKAHVLLEADYREFVSMFALARRDLAQFSAERNRARRRITAMTGLAVDGELRPPDFRTQCLSIDSLLAGRGLYGALRLAQARRDELAKKLSTMGSAVPEAGLVISHGVVQELGGNMGGTTYLGIDFRMPLNWRDAADARRAEALAQMARTELDVEQGETQFAEAARQALENIHVRRANLAAAADRVAAARAQARTAGLRLKLAEGDVIEKYFQAQQGLYRASMDQAEAALGFERAQLEALALAPECPLETDTRPLSAPPAATVHALNQPIQTGSARRTKPTAGRFGWYAWAGTRWLEHADDPEWAQGLSPYVGRIMLSFKAADIAALAQQGELADRLQRFLRQANAHGMAVDLLLGDPEWLEPTGRQSLLEYVRALSRFPFDGLHLDLERSQMPAHLRPNYPRWLADTVRDIQRVSPWPVALSVHYREAGSPTLIRELAEAGLKELCLMVYLSDPLRVEQIAAPLLRRYPGLSIAVAQSIEPQLPPAESLAKLGRSQALAVLAELDRTLRRHPNFAGLRIQSLEDLSRLKP